MEFFGKEKKLWQTANYDREPLDEDKISPGRRMLDVITAHGSKLAQVFSV